MDAEMEPTISYSIRELLEEIKQQLTDIKHIMSEKVERSEHEVLQARVRELEHFRYRLVGVTVGLAMPMGASGAWILDIVTT